MAVALSPDELERTIEALSSAGETLQLTRVERLSYRALLWSVDGLLVSLVLLLLSMAINGGRPALMDKEFGPLAAAAVVLSVVFMASIVAGVVSLVLSIPLLRRAFREENRLKRLGLDSLSRSLWKESRRSRWISRLREVLSVGLGIVLLAAGVGMFLVSAATREHREVFFYIVPLYALIAGLLFAARYLRNQRERMDMAASAEQLRKALLSLRQREGSGVISVPAELLEQAERIESAQISKQRKDAVLQSSAFRANSCAVGFNQEAAGQRSALGVADRIELENLVAELSTNAAQFELQAPTARGTVGATRVTATKSGRVEIEYIIDRASGDIRVIAVRHRAETSGASVNGSGHG